MPEIKLCPFCGGEARLMDYYRQSYWVKCMTCGCQTDIFKEKPDPAIASWNRRKHDDRP